MDWAMAPLSEPERRDFREIWEGRYQVRPAILTSTDGLAPARTDRRSDAGRRHSRPVGPQRTSDRDAGRRLHAQESREAECIGLTSRARGPPLNLQCLPISPSRTFGKHQAARQPLWPEHPVYPFDWSGKACSSTPAIQARHSLRSQENGGKLQHPSVQLHLHSSLIVSYMGVDSCSVSCRRAFQYDRRRGSLQALFALP